MPSALDIFTKFVNSPGGVLAAGAVLAGLVWKFFERVEAVLTDQTKLEIAVWLLGVRTEKMVNPWPETFARLFDRVFGTKHLSWVCFFRSCFCSISLFTIALLYAVRNWHGSGWGDIAISASTTLLIPALLLMLAADYVSLLKSRLIIRLMLKRTGAIWRAALIVLDGALTSIWSFGTVVYYIMAVPPWVLAGYYVGVAAQGHPIPVNQLPHDSIWEPFFYPAFFTSVWIWLYAGSGFLLKAARDFDIGFDWFNRKFDIEKHPLQSIGLVAGAIVAVVYWAAVGISRLL